MNQTYLGRILAGNIAAVGELVGVVTRNKDLVRELSFRDVSDRYAGQALGLYWALAHPIFLMALYVFVFAVVFRSKVPEDVGGMQDYVAYILAGLIPWMAISEMMNKTCVSITSNSSLVKQVVFPIEVLPVKSVLASLATQLISTGILLVYILIRLGSLPLTVLLLPVVLVLQVVLMIGLAYVLAAAATYMRDIKDVVQVFSTAGMYIIPVVYLPGWVPELFLPFIYANPFSYVVWCYQDILYFGEIRHPSSWVILPVLSFVSISFGYRFFRRLKPGFGNVL